MTTEETAWSNGTSTEVGAPRRASRQSVPSQRGASPQASRAPDDRQRAPTRTTLDKINRPVWTRNAGVFAMADAWTDPGERNATHFIADEVRGKRILDVGVGAGRTTWLLRLVSADYVAVDYTPELVALARGRHPGADIREMDARHLSAFTDGSFDAVVFSWNGIDALDRHGRLAALAEFHRVLRDDGILLFSTLDKDGRGYRDRPWRGPVRQGSRARRAVRFAFDLPRRLPSQARAYRNWRRNRHASEDHGAWAISPMISHEFSLLTHYTTAAGAAKDLHELGFDPLTAFTDTGEQFDLAGPYHSSVYFHVIARKVAT